MRNQKLVQYLSWTATVMSIMMYISYVPQIINNLSGAKGNPIQPLVAGINCTLWVIYGLIKKKRDLPLAAANFPGIIFGIIAFWTAL